MSDELGLRLATPADSAALCALFKSVSVKSALELTQERDPDFFALLALHCGAHETLIAERAGQLVGCGSIVVRDGWLDGQKIKTGYLGDLRVAPAARGGGVLVRAYGDHLASVRERHGADLFTTVIFDSNTAARAALTKRSEKRASQPIYRELTPFHMTSVQFTTGKPRPSRAIRRAQTTDLPAIVELLARRGRQRVLGEVFDDGLLERRLAAWPGLTIDSFLLAHDVRGRLVGCLAPWDTMPFKRTRVVGYHGGMRLARVAFDLVARALGGTPLPPPGECFRFRFLTHLEIEDDDPAVLRDLLLAAYAADRGGAYHFLSAMIPRGSPLERAFGGFRLQRTPMTLYSVAAPDSAYAARQLRTLHPGFEMALS